METATATGAATPATRRGVFAWCAYDWANSAFPTVIMTFVFSAYFAQAVAASPTEGTAAWGFALTISGVAMAVASPVLGAIADQTGRRKPWIAALTAIAVVATALLWFTRPDPSSMLWGLVVVSVANLAFEIGTVFYNAMLPDLVPEERLGRISGWAWGLGYFGGLTALVVCLFGFVQADAPPFGLDRDALEHVRVTAPFVALWWTAFAIPLFVFTPDRPRSPVPVSAAVVNGVRTLAATLRHVGRYRDIARFLVARLFYTDGLNTLFAFGGIYAAGTFGMSVEDIIVFGIALNVSAGLGAFAFGWVDDLIGAKRTVLIAIVGLIALGIPILLTHSVTVFWVLAVALGIFMGPAQAASRSLMARLAPPALRTEMFGLFALSGKITAFIGPALLGWATLAFDSQRAGMATVLVLLALGGAVMLGVREPAARR